MRKALWFLLCIASAVQAQTIDSRIFGDIKARWIGPAIMSGRISCLDVVNSDTKTMYIGSASGGVWKTEDGGTTFKPVFDKYTQSIGAICIDQKNPKTIWAGTGESWVRNSVSVGTGIYKSTDGGMNWKKMGLDSTERISRIAIDPSNSDVVYVAAPGHLWNDDSHRGLYKTTDGGKTWQKILYTDEKTGCADVAVDPTNSNVVYAAMWQFRRTAYSFESGGSGSALYKSIDGGKTWNKLTNGLPSTPEGRIALVISPVNPNIVFATIEYAQSAMFKSDDKGGHWVRRGTTSSIVERPFYFSRLVCDPKDTNIVYRAGLSMVITRDGGNSFSQLPGAHGDHHDIWINPNNNSNVVMGTDGGLFFSYTQGSSWFQCRSLPVSQFYHVMYDMEEPYNVYGGLQDNSAWYGPNETTTGGIPSKAWSAMVGGDGFWAVPDQNDNNIIYAETQGGAIIRYDRTTKITKDIQPYAGTNEQKYRFNWNTPIAPSPGNKNKIYFGSQYLLVTYDKGETWKRISPDLTTNNPKYQQQENSGGLTADNSSAENLCTIYTIAESPLDSSVVWAGTDDGNVQVTQDGGKTWKNVVANISGIPKETWVSTIEAGHFNKGTAYATFDAHTKGDMNAYVYKTTDFGQTWMKISNDSIKGYCHTVREDLKNPDLLFVGSEFGLFISIDGGTKWSQLNYNNSIPNVAIRDMVIHPRDNDLILATHGRGIMIIDEPYLDLLRQLSASVVQQKFYLFKTPPYTIPLNGFDWPATGDDDWNGANPNHDPMIAYYLKDKQLVGEFRLDVLDEKGNVVNNIPAGKHKGINIVSVPLRMKPPKVPPAPLAAFAAATGPDLPEGTYKLRLIHGKDTTFTEIKIQQQKNSPYTVADRQARWNYLQQSYNMLNDFAYTVDCITIMRDKAKALAGALPEKDKLALQLNQFAHVLDTLHQSLVYTKEGLIVDMSNGRLREQLATIYGTILGYDGRPNNSAIDRLASLKEKMNVAETTFISIMNSYLPKINQQLKAGGKEELVRETREVFNSKP